MVGNTLNTRAESTKLIPLHKHTHTCHYTKSTTQCKSGAHLDFDPRGRGQNKYFLKRGGGGGADLIKGGKCPPAPANVYVKHQMKNLGN